MSFIVIEGLDGSGKTTQTELLKRYLRENKLKYEFIHFPTSDSPVYGDLISKFLRGELGKLEEVNPYLVALLFAGDRYNMSKTIQAWLNSGKFVINDRYVYSNIGFQCAKTKSEEDSKKLFDWIFDIEYNYFKIPKPNLSLFLDVPFEFTRKKLSETRTGCNRDYLKGKEDIHEANLDFQKKVKETYLQAIKNDNSFVRIQCYDHKGILSPELISELIIKEIINHGLLTKY